MVMAMTGPPSSRAPFRLASSGDIPSSMCRWMFSTTTMASSTTSPIASTMASSVSRLMVKPIASMRKQAPTSDSGIATIGMMTERTEPRKRKMTTTTMTSASTSVLMTSSIALWM